MACFHFHDEFLKLGDCRFCVVFFEPRPGIDHLCLQGAEEIISSIKPKQAILTHFGMTMLKAKPHIQAEKMKERLGIDVVAAYDGMTINF